LSEHPEGKTDAASVVQLDTRLLLLRSSCRHRLLLVLENLGHLHMLTLFCSDDILDFLRLGLEEFHLPLAEFNGPFDVLLRKVT